MIQYSVVYDLRETAYWGWVPPLLVGVLVTFALVQFGRAEAKRRTARLYWVGACFAALAALGVTLPPYMLYRRMLHQLSTGQAPTIEGIVTGFSAGGKDGHPPEWFSVDGHLFEYSNGDMEPGFNRASETGGLVRNGERVRIASVDGRIARLEIASKIVAVPSK